jgi:hypothetical protein
VPVEKRIFFKYLENSSAGEGQPLLPGSGKSCRIEPAHGGFDRRNKLCLERP